MLKIKRQNILFSFNYYLVLVSSVIQGNSSVLISEQLIDDFYNSSYIYLLSIKVPEKLIKLLKVVNTLIEEHKKSVMFSDSIDYIINQRYVDQDVLRYVLQESMQLLHDNVELSSKDKNIISEIVKDCEYYLHEVNNGQELFMSIYN